MPSTAFVFQHQSIPCRPHSLMKRSSSCLVEAAASKPRPACLLHKRFSTMSPEGALMTYGLLTCISRGGFGFQTYHRGRVALGERFDDLPFRVQLDAGRVQHVF